MADACLDSGPNIALTLVGDPGSLHAEPILSADPEQGIVVSPTGDGVWAPRRPPIVNTPIGSGSAGWERYVDVGSNRIWGFVYTNGQWNFVGGPDLFSVAESGGTFGADSNNAWHGLGDPPSIDVPMSMTYMISWGGAIKSGEDVHACQLGLSVGGGNPDANAICQNGMASVITVSRSIALLLNSGTKLTLKGKSAATSGTNTFDHIWIKLAPVHT